MKIGIVSPYYMHTYGGVQTLIKGMQAQLQTLGHECYIIAPKPPNKADVDKTPAGVYLLGTSREINFKVLFHTTLPLATSRSSVIADFLKKEKFDILNIHEPWIPLLPYQILQEATCPIVGTTHARWPKSLVNQSLEKIRTPYFRFVLNKINLITAVSQVSANNVLLIEPKFNLKIIPNAVSVADLQAKAKQYKDSNSSKYMLYLNRLEKRKGPKLFLKAYRKYVRQTSNKIIPIIIAGSGPQEMSLKNYVAKHGLSQYVEFKGFIDNETKWQLFSNAHIYISPAPYGESFGIVLLEAMAFNVPIIAGNNSGYKTVLKNQGANSLVDPYNTNSFASLIDQFCNDDQIRQNWQKWAETEILNYDFKTITAAYEDCFKTVLKSI